MSELQTSLLEASPLKVQNYLIITKNIFLLIFSVDWQYCDFRYLLVILVKKRGNSMLLILDGRLEHVAPVRGQSGHYEEGKTYFLYAAVKQVP